MTSDPPARRTQRERREATIGRLLDAGIRTIAEIGYARASVKEICTRAGVSHGALFRHFENMLDFMVATAEEAARRQIADFEARLAAADPGGDPLETVLRLCRAAASSPVNAVFYELVIAARTDAELRHRLRPMLEAYGLEIYTAALRLPVVDGIAPDLLLTLVSTILHAFDGEAVTRAVLPMPELEERRIALLVGLLRGEISFPRTDPAAGDTMEG